MTDPSDGGNDAPLPGLACMAAWRCRTLLLLLLHMGTDGVG